MRIFKYELKRSGECKIRMPVDSRIMDIQAQDGKPVIWVACDPQSNMQDRSFMGILTGDNVFEGDLGSYLGTVQFQGGAFVQEGVFVVHYFDKGIEDDEDTGTKPATR